MDTFNIKSEKQDNGLWGTPMNIVGLKTIPFYDNDDEVKFSGILMALGERYPNGYITVQMMTATGSFEIFLDQNGTTMTHYTHINHYGLIDNTLYFIKEDEDRTIYERMLKLKKIKDELISDVATSPEKQ
jgi:hypothetical protein